VRPSKGHPGGEAHKLGEGVNRDAPDSDSQSAGSEIPRIPVKPLPGSTSGGRVGDGCIGV
jgi:hypothetical protein